jgi:hypothetical protein
MKTESNIKPTMVERYPGLVRVNFAVDEKTVRDSDGSDDRTMYTYQMIETKELPKRFDELFALLYYDRYPVDVQVHTLVSGTQSEIFAIDKYRRECVRTAKALLDIPYTLDEAKDDKIAEITAYDASEAVNSFSYNGVSMWLDKETRTGLSLRFRSEQAAGNTQTTLWSGTRSFTLNIEDGMKLLAAVEVYASASYDVTAKHKANVLALTSMEDVEKYDYKTGYPEKLSFTTYKG